MMRTLLAVFLHKELFELILFSLFGGFLICDKKFYLQI